MNLALAEEHMNFVITPFVHFRFVSLSCDFLLVPVCVSTYGSKIICEKDEPSDNSCLYKQN